MRIHRGGPWFTVSSRVLFLVLLLSSERFGLIQYGIYVLGEASTRSTPSFRSLRNVACKKSSSDGLSDIGPFSAPVVGTADAEIKDPVENPDFKGSHNIAMHASPTTGGFFLPGPFTFIFFPKLLPSFSWVRCG